MREVVLSCFLDAPVDRVWEELHRPGLLLFVARPILGFRPVRPDRFPETWAVGEYVVALRWRGLVPLGRQTISISHPEAPEGCRALRDNGHSGMIRRWDHLITLEPEGAGTRYTDRVSIEAEVLTWPVAMFARSFYAHRQRRWRALVAAGFDTAKAERAGP
ncbi:MAG: hypothetical protein AAFR53_15955 [Pseudomonadota bacterium]